MKKTDKKLLFVCNYNIDRSPTAETIIDTDEKYFKYFAKSAGIYDGDMYGKIMNSRVLKLLTKDLLLWADMIFVFEQDHIVEVGKIFPEYNSKNIINLNIPDIYHYMDSKLVDLIKERTKTYLQ